MIEPHSAQLGASSWILNATFVDPRLSVTVPEPLPFPAFAGAAWPLVATTASSSRAGEEAPLETELAAAAEVFAVGPASAVDAATSEEPAPSAAAPPPMGAASMATEALGWSLDVSAAVDPVGPAIGGAAGAALSSAEPATPAAPGDAAERPNPPE